MLGTLGGGCVPLKIVTIAVFEKMAEREDRRKANARNVEATYEKPNHLKLIREAKKRNLAKLTIRSCDDFTKLAKPLAELTKLKELNLQRNKITDLSPLVGLKNLQELNLSDNIFTDLSPLEGLTNLKELDLSRNNISDLSPLEGLSNLQELNLSANTFTDLSSLEGLTNLKELDLSRNNITDLSPLEGLTNLQTLRIYGILIPEEQIAMLKKALPDCSVRW